MCERTTAQLRRIAPIGFRMNSRLVITLLCAGAVALACGRFTRNDTPAAQAQTTARTEATVAAVKEAPKLNSNFALRIEPRALNFAFVVTNERKKQVELAFPNGQEYDFAVLDSVGREVYRWGKGRMFTQSVRNATIDGKDTLRIAERVVTTLPQGKYVAIATLRSSNFPIKQVSAFELR